MNPLYVESIIEKIDATMAELADVIEKDTAVKPAELLDRLIHVQGFAYAVQDSLEAKETARQIAQEEPTDAVNHPDHYKIGGIETIDFIEAKQLGFHLGNVVKYVARAGHKSDNALQDLRKAAWYLQREIDNRNNQLELFEDTND